MERLSCILIGPACLLYSLGVFWYRGLAGIPAGMIFLFIALAMGARFLISVAARENLLEVGHLLHLNEDEEDES